MATTATVIADSISEQGIRITTLELEFPCFLLAQFNTHRMFSRNAQSIRAVPTEKLIEVLNSNEVPVFRQAQKGMQAGEIIERLSFAGYEAKKVWIDAKTRAVFASKNLQLLGVAKEITNRLLEPFSTIKVVVTATEWDNFFALRLHRDAQHEMQELAQAMKTAMDVSTPDLLENCEFHLPYISNDELSFSFEKIKHEKLQLISAARCDRVSYLNHDNSNPDIEKDLELANRLLKDGHMSCFEHQAKPMTHHKSIWSDKGQTHQDKKGFMWSNNFRGWIMQRALLS